MEQNESSKAINTIINVKLSAISLVMENYQVLPKYYKCILSPLTWIVGSS